MSISSRIHDTIEDWQAEWKDRLRGWMESWVIRGANGILEGWEPEAIDLLRVNLAKIADNPATPQDIKDVISKLQAGTQPLPLLILIPLAVLMFIPMLTSIFQPLGNILRYFQERVFKSFRLDPATITNVWRRDKPFYEQLFDDLRDLGFSEERIAVVKELAKILPPLPDMVRFADFSAFDPEVIAAWREFYDAPGWISDPMSLIGVTNEEPRDWANKYWFSHWIQPGRFELGEMYRRGLMGTPLLGQDEIGGGATEGEAEATIKLAYRTMGYSSFWQDRLLQLVREIPTRVDIRRWWDMRTIDETELRSLYQRHGYFGKDLENYVVWTKVYVAFPDLMARFTKGWISEEDVRAELIALGMPAARVDELIQTKVKPEEPERVTGERDVTKTDIYKGVKQGVITRDEGIELLQELGYDEDEADYLLVINIPPDQEEEVIRERELSKTDIKTGIKQEILSIKEARVKLLELRYNPADVEFLLNIYQVVAKPPVEIKLKEASKADIVLGVKKGLITQSEAHDMLLDLGYDPAAADFILLVKTEETPFSAKSFEEFKDITAKYRRAAGMTYTETPEELKTAADELVRIKLEVEALERAVKEERRLLTAVEEVPDAASAKLKKLQVTLNRARAELQRIQLNYNSLVAQWRHGAD